MTSVVKNRLKPYAAQLMSACRIEAWHWI